VSERQRIEMKIKQAENKVLHAQSFLDKLIIKSPVDGILLYGTNLFTGEKIKAGDNLLSGFPLLQIPSTEVLQVNMQVNETRITDIEVGQYTEIRIDARPGVWLTGRVTKVASTGKPINYGSKIKAFEVIVEVDSTDQTIPLGLSATCAIFTQQIPDTFCVPIECVFLEDSTDIVYVQKEDVFKIQPVSLGERNEDFFVITKGLHGGEEIALHKPPSNLIDYFIHEGKK
jgi:hypothetical protein